MTPPAHCQGGTLGTDGNLGHRRLAWCGEQPEHRFEGWRGRNGAWGGTCRVEKRRRPSHVGNSKGTRAGEQHRAAGRAQGTPGGQGRGRAWVTRALKAQAALKSWGLQNDPSASGLPAPSPECWSLPQGTGPRGRAPGGALLHCPDSEGGQQQEHGFQNQRPSPEPRPPHSLAISLGKWLMLTESVSRLQIRGNCPPPAGESKPPAHSWANGTLVTAALTGHLYRAFSPCCGPCAQSLQPHEPPGGGSKMTLL